MFVTVKYGDVIDLSDEKGVVKNLRKFPQEYAKEYLKDREILILLRVEKRESPNTGRSSSETGHHAAKTVFTPLLNSLVTNADFMETLNPSREEDSLSEVSSKSSRRRSSTFDMDDLKSNSGRAKSKTSLQSAGRKPATKRALRPPLRKTTTAS
ncbi:hypothetical protein PoB_003852100 [Plakobranchus ocellatus]|uniref:Uncharacterized protein n=1 Tax=Plakobranchus ocellatus TaxID=259542 RepID=A0AAV4AZM5_9GAST|nr:hypothetical protein PoB_003852100 [Plakobranchus ocellatus]